MAIQMYLLVAPWPGCGGGSCAFCAGAHPLRSLGATCWNQVGAPRPLHRCPAVVRLHRKCPRSGYSACSRVGCFVGRRLSSRRVVWWGCPGALLVSSRWSSRKAAGAQASRDARLHSSCAYWAVWTSMMRGLPDWILLIPSLPKELASYACNSHCPIDSAERPWFSPKCPQPHQSKTGAVDGDGYGAFQNSCHPTMRASYLSTLSTAAARWSLCRTLSTCSTPWFCSQLPDSWANSLSDRWLSIGWTRLAVFRS